MFRRKHSIQGSRADSFGRPLLHWDPLANHSTWIQQAISSLNSLEGIDRIAVWLEPELGEGEQSKSAVFRGEIWESHGGLAPAEWSRISDDAPLPKELLTSGKSVETFPTDLSSGPMLGVQLDLRHALWTPIHSHQLLRGLIMVGTRSNGRSLPFAASKEVAAQLALLLDFECLRRLSAKRESDLALWRNIQTALSSETIPQLLLKDLVDSCTTDQKVSGVGALFALIVDAQTVPRTLPLSEGSTPDRIRVIAESGDPERACSAEHGPLESLWRQAFNERRVVGADPYQLPFSKKISRIVAMPIEYKNQVYGVLLAGIPLHSDALEIVERLELRALLAAQVMDVLRQTQLAAREKAWQMALLDSSAEKIVLIDAHGFLLGMSREAREFLREKGVTLADPSDSLRFAELFRPREWEKISQWVHSRWVERNGALATWREAHLCTGSAVRIRCLADSGLEFLAVAIESMPTIQGVRGVAEVESELRQTLDWLQEGVLIFDQLGAVRAMNSRSRQILGISTEAASAIHTFQELLSYVSPNATDPERFAADWQAFAQEGTRESQEELAMEWPVPQLIERSMKQILDKQGNRIGWVEVYQEMTARKMFQSRMLQTEKLASLGQRATGIAHELANPLTTILGTAQRLIQRDPEAADSPEILRILEESERASSILRQLLQLSRESQPLRRHVCLNDLAERTVALQRVSLSESSVQLRLEIESSLPPIDGDFAQLQQVLLNLLQNAQQAIEQSGQGSTITVRTKSTDDNRVRLEVSDNGPGIPPSVQGRIYDPFFTTKSVGAGTGLGLSIALGFVRQNGGTLSQINPKQGGCCFVVQFPVAHGFVSNMRSGNKSDSNLVQLPGRIDSSVEIDPDRHADSPPRILIVEDEPTVAALIADVLRDGGLRVDVLLDSQAAIQQIEREAYDLLVCDLKMPKIDGQAFYGLLLERRHPLHGKVLFVTGDIISPRSQEFLARHHLPHVAKPFRMDELLGAVRELLAANQTIKSAIVNLTSNYVSGSG